jgi:HIV Tat-specific factor 1
MGEMWMYVDATSGSEKGPLTEEIMKRLIRKGIIQPNQYVWNKTLKEWTPLMNVEPFKTYHETWSAFWYFMVEKQQKGPIVTKDLVSLFIDGEIDGLTIVWTKSMSEWKAIGEVQVLKEFLQEANADYERETEVLKKEAQVSAQDQVYEESTSDVFVADDGKQYLFDSETRKWVTPEEKIEDDLNALREEAAVVMHPNESKVNNTNNEDKEFNTRMPLSPTKSTLNVEQSSTNYSEATDEKPKKRKKKKKKSDKWKVSKKKTWVYVNGLPLDITEQEIHDHFSKCGLIQQDIMTNKPRIKLYENKDLGGLNVSFVYIVVEYCISFLCTIYSFMSSYSTIGGCIHLLYERSIC